MMRCPICSEEVNAEDPAERWGPEFAHATCVMAYNAGALTERERWSKPAFLWPAGMPDDVARWISANPPEVVPRDVMAHVAWPNVRAKFPAAVR